MPPEKYIVNAINSIIPLRPGSDFLESANPVRSVTNVAITVWLTVYRSVFR